MTARTVAKDADKDRWKSKARSKVSNSPNRLLGVDQRSERARRFRDISTAVAMDLGGAEALSEVKVQLVRRLALCCLECEDLEAAAAAGKEIDFAKFCALASTLVRLSNKIGLGRTPKNVVPDLETYLATNYRLNPVTPETSEPEAAA